MHSVRHRASIPASLEDNAVFVVANSARGYDLHPAWRSLSRPGVMSNSRELTMVNRLSGVFAALFMVLLSGLSACDRDNSNSSKGGTGSGGGGDAAATTQEATQTTGGSQPRIAYIT